MSGGLYSGDEVGALVIDSGSHTVRAGYAGDEYPKFDIPSIVGVVNDDVEMKADNGASGEFVGQGRKIFIDTTMITQPREKCELNTFMKDSMVDNWDLFENMIDHLYGNALRADASLHPVLFTEPAWNERSKREKLIEIMMEKYKLPAFHLVKNAVLTAFANGRTHGLIVDSGATHTSAVPVFDGYCITHAVVRAPVGGDLIVEQLKKLLVQQKIDLVPTYRIKSKQEVGEGEPAIFEERKIPPVTKSYDDYMKKQVLEDLALSVLQLCDTPLDLEFAEKLPSAPYSFPNGFNKEFLVDRVKVPECLFDLKYIIDNPHAHDTLQNVAHIANSSCSMCDIDMRSSLYSNLVVTGGNSLLLGFSERLNHDLALKCPPTVKLRVSAAPTPMERRFGAWIGGSIVASLGSFQQMWVSAGEYDEAGSSIVEKKCP